MKKRSEGLNEKRKESFLTAHAMVIKKESITSKEITLMNWKSSWKLRGQQ